MSQECNLQPLFIQTLAYNSILQHVFSHFPCTGHGILSEVAARVLVPQLPPV